MDRNTIRNHTYTYNDFSLDSNVFHPTIFTLDDSSCLSTYEQEIVLYRPAALSFSAANRNACEPGAISFSNKTQYAKSYLWDFDGDGIYDDTAANPTFVYSKPGV